MELRIGSMASAAAEDLAYERPTVIRVEIVLETEPFCKFECLRFQSSPRDETYFVTLVPRI